MYIKEKPRWVRIYEKELADFYKEPVRPVSQYCDAFREWAKAIDIAAKENEEGFNRDWVEVSKALSYIDLPIRKSNYLYRLIYLGQSPREEKCPIHKGHWSGYGTCQNDPPCNSGWDVTGWLPNEDDEPGTSPIGLATVKEERNKEGHLEIKDIKFSPNSSD